MKAKLKAGTSDVLSPIDAGQQVRIEVSDLDARFTDSPPSMAKVLNFFADKGSSQLVRVGGM